MPLSFFNRWTSLLESLGFSTVRQHESLQTAIDAIHRRTSAEVDRVSTELGELRTEMKHQHQDFGAELSKFHRYSIGEISRNDAELNKLAQACRELALLTEQAAVVHSASTGRTSHLEAELSQLHTLVIERLAAQLQLLNQQIWRLKGDFYHSQWMPDPKAFNGQFSKQRMFEELCGAFSFDNFVETGSHHGATSEFLGRIGKPVYSVEVDPGFYQRVRGLSSAPSNVSFLLGDSPVILDTLSRDILQRDDLTFFYLDAHWREHLPLREELKVIASQHPHGVVMIDDIKVEGDPGYGYDSYDKGQEITLTFLHEELRDHRWQVFFPTLPSSHDHTQTDVIQPRGTAVMACEPEITVKLKELKSLRYCHRDY